ncbi:hypothetical protein H1R20_g1985, partial [Candolleomyces eurysporus]
MEVESEYQESTCVTFEWTLRGLKSLFDSTKGDTKSKVTRSPRFGDGRWQILFYANAGVQKEGNDGYVSLYLSCEPTPAEKEAALSDNGRVEKSILYNLKEAVNHSFSYKTANWGWAQFARRDNIYYTSPNVKAQDAFVIICSVVSTPVAPPPPPPVTHYSVPKPLLDTIGSLLDDPAYSDVQFIIARRGQDSRTARRIWASKKILSRADYFSTMFSSNFAEGVGLAISHGTPKPSSRSLSSPKSSFSAVFEDEFEDSDDDDDEVLAASLSFDGQDAMTSSISTEEFSMLMADTHVVEVEQSESAIPLISVSRPPSPMETEAAASSSKNTDNQHRREIDKPQTMAIVIKDVAYSTYKAILYYIYTDTIVFAPLSSSFSHSKLRSPPSGTPVVGPASESSNNVLGGPKRNAGDGPTTRAEWIVEWTKDNPGRPAPCSAKAVYRVADKLDLGELKERASKHIFKSLTVDNIAYEVFSPFAATFEEVRKVEIEFFLNHWHEIRASESMRTVWHQIRSGRHPGFEEVWPLIAQSLEFKPTSPPQATTSKASVGAAQPQ